MSQNPIANRDREVNFLSKNEPESEKMYTGFTKSYQTQNIILPIAHHDGNYFCDAATLKQLEDKQQIAFKYLNNPNGSVADIAGIFNKEKNILGMMPHPERAIDKLTGNIAGLDLFSSLIG